MKQKIQEFPKAGQYISNQIKQQLPEDLLVKSENFACLLFDRTDSDNYMNTSVSNEDPPDMHSSYFYRTLMIHQQEGRRKPSCAKIALKLPKNEDLNMCLLKSRGVLPEKSH